MTDANDRRRGERRDGDRRRPGDALDVTRGEHENLYSQVMQNAQDLRRIEAELRRIRELLQSLTSAIPTVQKRQSA